MTTIKKSAPSDAAPEAAQDAPTISLSTFLARNRVSAEQRAVLIALHGNDKYTLAQWQTVTAQLLSREVTQ